MLNHSGVGVIVGDTLVPCEGAQADISNIRIAQAHLGRTDFIQPLCKATFMSLQVGDMNVALQFIPGTRSCAGHRLHGHNRTQRRPFSASHIAVASRAGTLLWHYRAKWNDRVF